ncbi:MAG: hypothetical protein KGS61_07035 [Verrucomicrobia bacterium]|nr:hypothetical protein [Verrucomicrobiota bacterium]
MPLPAAHAPSGSSAALAGLLAGLLACEGAVGAPGNLVGIVSHIKVLSDKVADVSSLEAWKQSFIGEDMTDEQKALAIWRSNVAFVYQDAPPLEFLQAGCVHDAIKEFNVYGYGMCCCASARVAELARYVGLPARGWGLNGHSVPEVGWDNRWHLLDASLVNYFPDAGGVASVADVVQAVQGWLAGHPDYRGNDANLRRFQQAAGWNGWRAGPALLSQCPFYDGGGWWPARTHGWNSTMEEYDGSRGTPFPYEYGYSQGYQVNIQLRRGERLTRNWFNEGQQVNGVLGDGAAPGCLRAKVGEGPLAFLRRYGDLNDGRVGCGTLEYAVPLADGSFRDGALTVENVACEADDHRGPAIHPREANRPAVVEFEMPSSYVYLTGRLAGRAAIGPGGRARVLFSDNNGLDWREAATITAAGDFDLDLQRLAFRRYTYRLRLVFEGAGTGLDRLRITHAIQCSQRALPTLDRGDNTIRFSAGPAEGTVTIEGSTEGDAAGKQVSPLDFHPVLEAVEPRFFQLRAAAGSVTFPIRAPGELTRLRFGGHYRLRDARDRWEMQVSFDGGRTFATVDTQSGPCQGICRYVTVEAIPPGARQALVRWRGAQRNTTCLFLLRIDADYRLPHGGFRPVRVTYRWLENGVEHRDAHIARSPTDTYHILCAAQPTMKSLALEWAE